MSGETTTVSGQPTTVSGQTMTMPAQTTTISGKTATPPPYSRTVTVLPRVLLTTLVVSVTLWYLATPYQVRPHHQFGHHM